MGAAAICYRFRLYPVRSMSSVKPASPIERAFEMARSGEARSVDEIKKRLAYEGHDQKQIFGRTLSRQLRAVMRESGTLIKPTR
jgi:Ribonuclease G/E